MPRFFSEPGDDNAKRGARCMTDPDNEKALTEPPLDEHPHDAERLRDLEAGATAPWVKQYLRSPIEECERMAGQYTETGPRLG